MREYLTLAEAAERLPGKPARCTVYRWCVNGLRAPRGDCAVYLRHVRLGHRIATTEEWLEEFFERLAAEAMAQRERRSRRRPSASERARRLREADEILSAAGI